MNDLLSIILIDVINNIGISGDEDIKDLKDIITFDFNYIYILVPLAIILLFLILFILKKKINNTPKVEKQALPPELAALDKIRKLRESKLIELGRNKEFYTILSEIIRAFIEDKYKIPAMDQTTYELLSVIKNKNIFIGNTALVQNFLSDCDLVKFAKHIPVKEDSYKMLNIAEEIINITNSGKMENQPEIKSNV